ncbi:substrate-binding domain-containing protein [Victivallis vadensis]|uniref:substrate-binding domain-containing protein n=1 Tax=Victivallis vadensis TaxID=172901 RepID=UPI003AF93814
MGRVSLKDVAEAAGVSAVTASIVLNGSGSGIPEVPRVGRYSHEDGRVILQYLHERKQIPRCMVCGDDDIAMGLLKAAREYGIRIPEELAVIGFDDDVNADYLCVPLTSVHQPLEEFGRLAVDYVLEKMNDPGRQIQLTIEPKLIERSTT